MKKILLISFEYPMEKTYCGGVGQIVKQNRGALLELGYEVYVLITPEFIKKSPLKLLLPDNTLNRYPNFHAFQKAHNWLEFDYIIQHFVNWAKELKKIKNQRNGRPKIIYHFHSILRRERDSGFKTLNSFLLNQERMIEIADKIICPSRYEYDNFTRYFPYFSEKVCVVENTIECFPPHEETLQHFRDTYRIKESDTVSIYVGRLERIKGAHMLTQYLPEVLKRNKNLKIFIIGKTLERAIYRKLKMLQKTFPQQLFYIKYLEKDKLFQLYYLSTIYINTSLSESFSLTTHESALCHNALLLNSLAVFEKFKNASFSFSIQDGNGHGFISQYECLIKNKLLRERFAKRAHRVARDFFKRNRLKEDLSLLLQRD